MAIITVSRIMATLLTVILIMTILPAEALATNIVPIAEDSLKAVLNIVLTVAGRYKGYLMNLIIAFFSEGLELVNPLFLKLFEFIFYVLPPVFL